MTVLLAVGSPEMANILKRHLEGANIEVLESEVLHRRYLDELVEIENPSMVILHDTYLPSEYEETQKRDEELLGFLNRWRINHEDLRVVFLCERDRRDPFLGDLVARNVFDIFHEQQIAADSLIEQLSAPPRYANVAKFGVGTLTLDYNSEEAKDAEELEDGPEAVVETTEEKPPTMKTPKPPKPQKEKKEKKEKFLFSELKEKMPNVQIHVHRETEQQKVQVTIGRKIIFVVSPFARTGSSFISHQLAYQLAKQGNKVAYFENPFRFPYTYDRLAGHLHYPNYVSSYANKVDSPFESKPKAWEVEGVTIEALNPTKEKPYMSSELTISRFLRLFLAKHETSYMIIDLGADTDREIYTELMDIASHIFLVMEPDIANFETFDQNQQHPQFNWIHRIKDSEKTKVIINRYSDVASKVLPFTDFFPIASVQDQSVMQAQVNGTFSFPSREENRKQEKAFAPLVKEVLGKDSKTEQARKSRFFPRIQISRT